MIIFFTYFIKIYYTFTIWQVLGYKYKKDRLTLVKLIISGVSKDLGDAMALLAKIVSPK